MNQSVQPAEAAPDAETPGTLNGIPRQSTCRPPRTGEDREPKTPETSEAPKTAKRSAAASAHRLRPWRILPTPTGTPFTFGYAVVLAATSLLTQYADPDLVDSLLHGSSTDVAHLSQSPVLVLVASALWIAGGITSPYAIVFLLVLTALERRIGGLRAAGVFLLGHVVATLATEVPVGFSVLAGHLPDSSLHRLDYGISFGVAASVGALAGLLTPWLRWTVLVCFGGMLIDDLIAFTDPMTNWGHLLALAIGVLTWPLLRRLPDAAARGASATGSVRRPAAGPRRAP
ncbi:rhomboid-like protein [Streptomyces atriruber]|uniref:Rhomboid-like protein n=1 Tax=Streptomyces atriruber TaxID=545121 RepID=A0ABV3BTX5_9ACTN